MAGYSGAPLAQKLGVKEGHRVLVIGAPPQFERALGKLPRGVVRADSLRSKGPFDVMICFVEKPGEVAGRLKSLMPRMSPACGLWFGWRKGQQGPGTLNEDRVREAALAAGLVDNKVCAIDETWSGLRVVIPLKSRRR